MKKKVLSVLMFVSLSLLISGCGSTPEKRNEPPKHFLEDTAIPSYNGTTFGDHYDYIELLRGGIDSCNIDKQSIKKYYEKRNK